MTTRAHCYLIQYCCLERKCVKSHLVVTQHTVLNTLRNTYLDKDIDQSDVAICEKTFYFKVASISISGIILEIFRRR